MNRTGVLKRRGRDTRGQGHACTEGPSCEEAVRGGLSASQGQRPATGLSLVAFRENQPCQHLDLELPGF